MKRLELTQAHKLKLSSYDKEFERELNDLVMTKLFDSLMRWEISKDIILWWQMVNQLRLSLMRNYIKENNDLK